LLPHMLPQSNFEVFLSGGKCLKSLILFGSPGRIRTIDQPVNSRLLYR
jgi:hypothetical protein